MLSSNEESIASGVLGVSETASVDTATSEASLGKMTEDSKALATAGGYTVPNLVKVNKQGNDYLALVIEFSGPGKETVTREKTVPSVGFNDKSLAKLAQDILDTLNATAIGPDSFALGVIDLSVLLPVAPSVSELAQRAFINDFYRLERMKALNLTAMQPQIEALEKDLNERYLVEYFDVL